MACHHMSSNEMPTEQTPAAPPRSIRLTVSLCKSAGYGDIHPTNSTERLVALLIMTVGMCCPVVSNMLLFANATLLSASTGCQS